MGVQPGLTETGRVDVGGGRLFYEARGAGRPVVLVHGGLMGRKVWDSVIAPLSRRYRVFRFDQRGYGESDRPAGVYSYWQDLQRMADHWSLPRAVYVGFAAGGAAVLDLALAAPDRVAAVVLVSSYLNGYDYSPVFQAHNRALTDAYLTNGASAVADALTPDEHFTPPAAQGDARKRLRELVLENAHVLAFNWMHVRPLDPLAAGRLADIQAPTLIVSAQRDSADNLSVADKLRSGISGARHVEIPASGHVIPVEAPAAMLESVTGFLSGLARPSA